MKSILFTFSVLASLLSSPAFADGTSQFYCKGKDGSEGITFFAKLLSDTQVREGDKMEFLLVIREGSEVIYSGHVIGENEDVMLSFRSKRGSNPKVSAMIYLDEYDQTWAKVGSREMQFACEE